MSGIGYLINKREAYNPKFDIEISSILDDFDASIAFHKSLPDYSPSSLIKLPELSKKFNVNSIWVKDESNRFGTNALKILGASYAVNHFSQNEKIIGICTATDGNHGRAVAWAAKQKGLKAVVFVPHYTTLHRIEAIRQEGAKVIVSKGVYDQAVKEAAYFAQEKLFKLIQDTAWKEYLDVPAYITSGYYTQLHELIEQTNNFTEPALDIIIVQAGVGSWPSAVVHFIRKYLKNNSIKILCIEPFESDCIYESMKTKRVAPTRKSQQTIMAGLNCGTPSVLAFEILRLGIDAFLLISDEYTIDAVKYLNAPLPGDPYIAAGESGASGLAAVAPLLQSKEFSKLRDSLEIGPSSNILVFNTENVTDPETTHNLLAR